MNRFLNFSCGCNPRWFGHENWKFCPICGDPAVVEPEDAIYEPKAPYSPSPEARDEGERSANKEGV